MPSHKRAADALYLGRSRVIYTEEKPTFKFKGSHSGQGFVFRQRDSYLGLMMQHQNLGSLARGKTALHLLRAVEKGVAGVSLQCT